MVAPCDSSPEFISVWQPPDIILLQSPVYSGLTHCKFPTQPFLKTQIYLVLLTLVKVAILKSHRDGALGADRCDELGLLHIPTASG